MDEKDDLKPGEAKTILNVLERLTQLHEAQPIPQVPVSQALVQTPWNPTGKKNRPRLRRRVFINGHPVSDTKLFDNEITLLNGLKHGRYHNRRWTVLEKDEDGASTLHIYWPNKTEADRMEIVRLAPNGLADLLVAMHNEMNSVKAAG